jgi:hypothetical protein
MLSVPKVYKGHKIGTMNQLWDIRQPVRMLVEDIVRIRYEETTSAEIENSMCGAVNSDLYSV